jgi:hypothetical protein
MAAKKQEPEIEALQAVHAALKPLSAEERSRVLASVYALLGISGIDVSTGPSTPFSGAGSRPTTREVPTRPQARPLSINELVNDKNPGTSAQFITLFAYYRDKHEGLARFGRDDLKAYFAKAKETPPTNYDRDFVEAVKKGWVHEDGDDSYVTSKGIEAVESGFAGERKYAKRVRSSRVARKPQTKKSPKARRQPKRRDAR